MAYFNIEYLEKRGVAYTHIMYLQLVHQNTKNEDMSVVLERYDVAGIFDELLEVNLVSTNKEPKKDSKYKRLRLTKKGRELYRTCQLANVSENDSIMFEYLAKEWDDIEKSVGNKTAATKKLAQFFVETEYNRQAVYKIIKNEYLPDMMEQEKGKFIPSLENFIWKGQTAFSKAFTLEDSRLYAYIQNKLKE